MPTNRPRRLRSDPVFKLIAGRSPEEDELACQSTLSRFENAVDLPALDRLRDVMIEGFMASFETPPTRLTFDIDIFDDPTHGGQPLTLFNGYYWSVSFKIVSSWIRKNSASANKMLNFCKFSYQQNPA